MFFNKDKNAEAEPAAESQTEQPAAGQQDDLAIYRQELALLMDESQANARRLKRELERQQSLISAAFGMEKAAKERLQTAQQELNRLESESRAAILTLAEAQQAKDRLMASYNRQLERVKELHSQTDRQSEELAGQQAQVKQLLAEWQRQDYFCSRQQQVLEALQAGRIAELPPLRELTAPPPEEEKPNPAKSDKPHANANFWEKNQHTALKLHDPQPTPGDAAEQTADEAEHEAAKTKGGKLKVLFSYAVCILLAVAVALAIRTWVLIPTEVSGASMSPTLESHDKLLTSPLPYLWGEPQRGDIIVFQAPNEPEGVFYVKRVIGLPGERVLVQDGDVYIDGELLDEPYLTDMPTEGYVNTIVPSGQVFVLGDNRTVSHDSRDSDVACIDYEEIYGKAVWRIAPLNSFGSIY